MSINVNFSIGWPPSARSMTNRSVSLLPIIPAAPVIKMCIYLLACFPLTGGRRQMLFSGFFPLCVFAGDEFHRRFDVSAKPAPLALFYILAQRVAAVAHTKRDGREVATHGPQQIGMQQAGGVAAVLDIDFAVVRRQPPHQQISARRVPWVGRAVFAERD